MAHNVQTSYTFDDPNKLWDMVAICFANDAFCKTAEGSNRTLIIMVDNEKQEALFAALAECNKAQPAV